MEKDQSGEDKMARGRNGKGRNGKIPPELPTTMKEDMCDFNYLMGGLRVVSSSSCEYVFIAWQRYGGGKGCAKKKGPILTLLVND